MIYRLVKNSRLSGSLLLVLAGIVLWGIRSFESPVYDFYPGENRMVLFYPLYQLISNSPVSSLAAGLLLVLLASLFIQRIILEYGFFRTRNLIPGVVFILITGGFGGMHFFHPVYPAIILLLLATNRLFRAFDSRKPYSHVFDAALLLSLGSLFYLNLALILPAFIVGGNILGRETRWRESVATITGFLIPWIFTFSWYFLTDQMPQLFQILDQNFLTTNNRITGDIPLMAFLGFLAILTMAGSYLILTQYDEKKVSIRQYYLVFFLMFLAMGASFFLVPSASGEALLVAAVPVTFLLSNLLLSFKRNVWGEIIMYLLAGLSIGLQFV